MADRKPSMYHEATSVNGQKIGKIMHADTCQTTTLQSNNDTFDNGCPVRRKDGSDFELR
jgi:hypothetical protein